LTKYLYPIRCLLSGIGALVTLVCVCATPAPTNATPSPTTAEFDIPYQLRLLADGTVLEVSGSFSWALPQNFQATLAAAPQVRLVRLESPGGHVGPAIQIATMIQQRGLDTYVGRFCASACTIAFLGGRQRWLAPGARLGFHQARAPGIPSEQVNEYLRTAYEDLHVPPAFIAHALRTPPSDLWFPTPVELRAVHYTTGDPPAAVLAVDHGWPPRLTDLTRRLVTASDQAVVQFGAALSDLLARLQDSNPEACWAFAHEGPDVTQAALPQTALDAIAAAEKYLGDATKDRRDRTLDVRQGKKAAAELVAFIREKDLAPALQGLRPGADHLVFCPSLYRLLQATLALPETHRADVLRAVLSPGGRSM
jgi:membrane-bound ClpP family serine protease